MSDIDEAERPERLSVEHRVVGIDAPVTCRPAVQQVLKSRPPLYRGASAAFP
ncbi:hypothetical protein [Streptomyces rishiriensis]|uniref:Uncharacterized protein n=1 Tax=Streptomyces rishiriensis TaxID=68264 RepID=A0ABU0P243_STRRH|nr:hypothetical protein [Streptomyces rishiriensis]MDQ0585419.1 hypothetical protein [Streptomyces rishiriensis]